MVKKYLILIIFIFLLIMPYIWFGNDLFVGGDDTRLFYSYPNEWINNLGLYSWFNFSSLGTYSPQFFILPLLYFLSFFQFLGLADFMIQNLSISIILILGFYYFYKFLLYISSEKYENEAILFSLFFILSPILYIVQIKTFLYGIWLIPIIPIFLFYGTKFILEGNFKNLLIFSIFGLVFSLACFSIPRFLGFLLPLFFVVLMLFIFKKISFLHVKRGLLLSIITILLQMFWLLPFVSVIFDDSGYISSQVLNQETQDTFKPTVDAVSYGNNIFYPLLNLFHYNLQKNFNHASLYIYDNFYLKLMPLSFLYIIILFFGTFYLIRNNKFKYIYLSFLVGFIISLFLFTARIGFFYDLFLSFGKIPGFVMFRNFFDKFALSYVIFFSIILFLSLINIKQNISSKKYNILVYLILFTIFINSIPLIKGDLFNLSLWQTNNIKTNLKIPQEYKDFTSNMNKIQEKDKRVLIVPYGISSYSYILGEKENTIFAGRSPIELFTGIQDISGRLSLNSNESTYFENLLINKDFQGLKEFFYEYNIGYVLYYPNLPLDFLNSYLFDKSLLVVQNNEFRDNIFGQLVLDSNKGNYQLYKIKDVNTSILEGNIGEYTKINNIKYNLKFNNLSSERIIFKDNFSNGWKWYLGNDNGNIFSFDNFIYFKKSLFDDSHTLAFNYANSWIISKEEIVNYVNFNYSSELKRLGYPKKLSNGKIDYKYYLLNKDGTIDVNLTFYFKQQFYFYLGLIISLITLLFLNFYLLFKFLKNKGINAKNQS